MDGLKWFKFHLIFFGQDGFPRGESDYFQVELTYIFHSSSKFALQLTRNMIDLLNSYFSNLFSPRISSIIQKYYKAIFTL